MVGFRVVIGTRKQQVEDNTHIHIADMQTMTEEILQRLRKKPSDTMVAQVVTSQRLAWKSCPRDLRP